MSDIADDPQLCVACSEPLNLQGGSMKRAILAAVTVAFFGCGNGTQARVQYEKQKCIRDVDQDTCSDVCRRQASSPFIYDPSNGECICTDERGNAVCQSQHDPYTHE